MSKAEEIRDKILKIINNRPQHIHQVGKDSWMSERVLEILEQYANEVSRERIIGDAEDAWDNYSEGILFRILAIKTNSNESKI